MAHTPRGTNAALPCIVCKRPMESIYGPNQPNDGLSFTSFGAYGSSFFDPMDGTYLEVTICDPCLSEHRDAGRVIEHPSTAETRAQSEKYGDFFEENAMTPEEKEAFRTALLLEGDGG